MGTAATIIEEGMAVAVAVSVVVALAEEAASEEEVLPEEADPAEGSKAPVETIE